MFEGSIQITCAILVSLKVCLVADTGANALAESAVSFRIVPLEYAAPDKIQLQLRPEIEPQSALYFGESVTNVVLASEIGAASTTESAVPPPLERPVYRITQWRTEQGLPHNRVRALLQTRDGYLWIGTDGGLARFDGVKFTVFDEKNVPAMVASGPNCHELAETQDGSLWIGTSGGLLRYFDHEFESYDNEPTVGNGRILALCAPRGGGLWIGTKRGLIRLEGEVFRPLTDLPQPLQFGATALCEDQTGQIWFGDGGCVQRLDPKSGRVQTILHGLPGEEFIHRFRPDAKGRVWLGGVNGLHYWEDGKIHWNVLPPSRLLDPAHRRAVHFSLVDRNGDVWTGAGIGPNLYQVEGSQVSGFQTTDGPVPEDVECACEDHEGNLWFGTRYSGLFRFQRKPVTTMLIKKPAQFSMVNSVCEGADGSVWMATRGGVIHWRGNEIQLFDCQVSLFQLGPDPFTGESHSILARRNGEIWTGHGMGGIGRLPSSLAEPWRSESYGPRFRRPTAIEALCEDRHGRIWFGSKDGLHCWDTDLKSFTTRDGLADNDVHAIFEDHAGRLWIGTGSGKVNCYSNGKFTLFAPEGGRPNDNAWSFHEDTDGALWIGTDSGLFRFQDGRWFAFRIEHGLFDNQVNNLIEDDSGRFWISCNRGIYHVERAALNAVAKGRSARVRCVAYGEPDGMVSAVTASEHQPSACKTRDGRLWFATQKGVAIINPRDIRDNDLPPPVVIEQLRANDQLVFGDGVRMPNPENQIKDPRAALAASSSPFKNSQLANSNSQLKLAPGAARVIEIRYTANSLVAPEKVHFQNQLEGYQSNWQDVGTRREAFYTNLKPGDYRFRVRACNNQGVWNETGAGVAFVIQPFFYQTWLFSGLCGLAVVALAGGVQAYRLRVQRRLLKLEQQHALDLERARIAHDMHDQLGANLSRMALSAGETGATGIEVRETLRELNELIWSVNPKHDTLASLADFLANFAQQYLGLAGLSLDLDFPMTLPAVQLPSALRHQLAGAFKEALRNVVEHAAATEVRITLRLDAGRLRLAIQDNGLGFDPANLAPARSLSAHRGNGLPNMRQRLADLGGSCVIDSTPGNGTRIEFSVVLGLK